MGHFGLKVTCCHNSGPIRDFFKILHNERGQGLHENYVNGFSKKSIILGKWVILGLTMDPLSDFSFNLEE